jgi:hypothetical protein
MDGIQVQFGFLEDYSKKTTDTISGLRGLKLSLN